MTDYTRVLSRLRKLRPIGDSGQRWVACCPAHEDHSPSLALWVGRRDGSLRALCYAGCSFHEIVEASGTEARDWFPEQEQNRANQQRRCRMMQEKKEITHTYPYLTDDGGSGKWRLAFEVVRFQASDGKKSFAQRQPDGNGGWIWGLEGVAKPYPIYNLHKIKEKQRHPVVIVEGEKDCDRLERLGILATTNPCGAGKWETDHAMHLLGRRVVVIPDNDAIGWKHALLVIGSLVAWGAASIKLLRLTFPGLTDPEGADVSDWLRLQGGIPEEERRARLIEEIRLAAEWKLTPGSGAA